jgi:hypothetical protein
MTILTPYEYDWVLDDAARQALANVHRQPMNDQHSQGYRRIRGKFMNGDPEADPRTYETVGYGTGGPFMPHLPVESLPALPSPPPVSPTG